MKYLNHIKSRNVFSIVKETWIIVLTSWVPEEAYKELDKEIEELENQNILLKLIEGWQLTKFIWPNSIKQLCPTKYNIDKDQKSENKKKYKSYLDLEKD